MKRAVLLLLVCLGVSWAAPVEQEGPEEASCMDPVVLGAAGEAMDKINKDRTEGYVFSLHSLVNAHTQKHGENSVVFYLTMNIQETSCSVLSKKNYKDCKVRIATPVYGQCNVAIFISRVDRVVRLYKYNCVVRPASAGSVQLVCPDCPSYTDMNSDAIQKTVSKSLEKFNKESGLSKHFALLKITRATSSWGMGMMYQVEYTIHETTCAKGVDKPEDCPPQDCEFTHYGFCKASDIHAPSPDGQEYLSVNCEVYEPEAALREEKLHALGDGTDHSHNDTRVADPAQGQDQGQAQGQDQGHTHSHGSHRHSHRHDHVHDHHEKAHNHANDHPNQHHKYEHVPGTSTHDHDHELALDHDHIHEHMHAHEHHHHHHHNHNSTQQHHPEGMWQQIPALSEPVTLPDFPDVLTAPSPEVAVTLPLKPDPQIPGQTEPTIGLFPIKRSAQCSPPPETTDK